MPHGAENESSGRGGGNWARIAVSREWNKTFFYFSPWDNEICLLNFIHEFQVTHKMALKVKVELSMNKLENFYTNISCTHLVVQIHHMSRQHSTINTVMTFTQTTTVETRPVNTSGLKKGWHYLYTYTVKLNIIISLI